MPRPPAINWGNSDAHEIDVRPSSRQVAGVGFIDPDSLRYVIAQRDIEAGELSAARDNGEFRCHKQSSSDVFAVGDQLSFDSTGYIAGIDKLFVSVPSAAGERFVFAELNRADGGGGLNVSQVQAIIDQSIVPPQRILYGNGIAFEFTLNHTLDTDSFTVYVEDTLSGEEVKPTIVDRTSTAVVIRHATAPSTNEFTAVLEVA